MIHLIQSAIHQHLRSLNHSPKDGQPIVTEEVLENMTQSLSQFVHNASVKFLKGHVEHGGDIRDRDLVLEFHQEQMDSFWYWQSMSWPKKPK